jgi:hypothetical protein
METLQNYVMTIQWQSAGTFSLLISNREQVKSVFFYVES